MTYLLAQFAALADPTRLAVFERLAKRPAAVHEIAQEFPVSRPAISQHLRVLKDARLVLDEPVGTQRIYRLNPSGIQEIRAYFDRFWDDALESFKAFIEIDQPKKREISPCTKPKSIPPSARQSS
jgi:DNA-binding transcriptional ArsR family regulator